MSVVDSAPVFEKRVGALGLGGALAKFQEFGWNTYGAFAFAAPTGAGGLVDNDIFMDTVVRPVLDLAATAPPPPETAALRRLFFESHTMALGELRARVERTDDSAPRRLPQVEREARRSALAARLAPAFVLEGDLEPANCVVDRVVSMVEDDRVEYLGWDLMATRRAELKVGPLKRKWTADATGTLKETSSREDPRASVSTFWEVSLALRRRSVAFDMGGLMSYEAHELLHSWYMKALTEDPGDAMYTAPSLERVRAADAWVWERLGAALARGVRPTAPGDTLPADDALAALMASMEFNLRLGPLPRGSGGGGGGGRQHQATKDEIDHDAGGGAGKKRNRNGRQKQQARRERDSHAMPPPPGNWFAGSGGKGGDRGGKGGDRSKGGDRGKGDRGNQGGGSGSSAGVPAELRPGVGRMADGTPICYAYNLEGCRDAADGGQCKRGRHVCTRMGCQRSHPAFRCEQR